MNPGQTAKYLRIIASKLDRSVFPDKNLVISDLKHILASIMKSRVTSYHLATDPGMEHYLNELYDQVTPFFRKYLAALGGEYYASAGDFQSFLQTNWEEWDESKGIPPFPAPENIQITYSDETLEETNEPGVMFAELDFYELCSRVSDEYLVEEHGSDKFDVSPANG